MNKIKMTSLAQAKHVKFLMLLEKQSKVSFDFVLRKMFFAIGKLLRQEKLAKSDDPTKLSEGWTGEVATIEVDIEGAVARVMDKHFKALQYMIMGDYAGKEAKAAAKEIGLKVVPGMMQSAYLHSIDAHREHFEAITGDDAPEIPRDLLKGSLDEIAKRSNRFLDKTFTDMKLEVSEAVDRVVRKTNQDNLNRVHKEAHDLLPSKGAEDAIREAGELAHDALRMTDINKELDGIEEKLSNKWDLTSCTELANASATGTHQAFVEIFGSSDDGVKVAWLTLEDEAVCSFCENASKDKAGNYKYYKISDFKPSGWNYGKKRSEWELQILPAHPRCYSDDMSVYTKEGWKMWADVTGDEDFFSVNLDTGSSEWVKATKLIKYEYNGVMEHFNSIKTDFLVTPNHTHIVKLRGRKNKNWQLVNGEDLPKTDISWLGSVPNWQGNTPDCIKIGSYSFDSMDFSRFMGMFLSEGSFTLHRKKSWQIKISQIKHAEAFAEISKRLFDKVWVGCDGHYIPIKDDTLINFFKQFGKSWDKFIPEEILGLSAPHLREFLTYFRMGDGSIKKNTPLPGAKSITYSETLFTSSNKMMSQLCEIIAKLNMRASYKLDPAKVCHHKNGDYLTKHPCWRISIGVKPAANSDHTVRTKIDYSGFVYDVELEKNHTLMVSRNGKIIMSGNCRCQLVYVPVGFRVDKDGSLVKK